MRRRHHHDRDASRSGRSSIRNLDDDVPSDQAGQGNTITADLAQADAIIDVMGGVVTPTVSATLTPHVLGDLTPGVALLNASPQRTFVDVTPNVSTGRSTSTTSTASRAAI